MQQDQTVRDGLVDVRLQGTIMDMLTDVNTGIGWVMEKIGHYGGRCCHALPCPVSRIPQHCCTLCKLPRSEMAYLGQHNSC